MNIKNPPASISILRVESASAGAVTVAVAAIFTPAF